MNGTDVRLLSRCTSTVPLHLGYSNQIVNFKPIESTPSKTRKTVAVTSIMSCIYTRASEYTQCYCIATHLRTKD